MIALRTIVRHTLAILNAAERRKFGFLTVANAIVSLADIVSLVLLLAVIRCYTQHGAGVDTSLPHWLSDKGSIWPACLFLLFFLIKNMAAYLAYRYQAQFVYGVASRISHNQLLHYLNGPYTDYVATDSAVQHRKINHQPIEFAHYILSGIQQLFTESVLVLLAISGVLWLNARLFLLLIVFLLPPVFLTAWLTRRRLKHARTHVKQDADLTMQYLQESLNGYIESHIYKKKRFFSDRYDHYQERLNGHLADLQIVQWIPARMVELFAVSGLFLMVIVNHYYGTVISTISIAAFVAAAYKIIPGIGRIANITAQMRTYSYSLGQISAEDHTVAETTATLPVIESISLKDLSFAHADRQVLHHFSLDLEKGDFVNLSAMSGKGKTTLLNLLLGFLTPDKGEILINETPVSTKERQQYQDRIAYVKQQSFLLHDTIQRNITLSDEADEQRLNRAIQAAGLTPFIESFPETIHKVVTDSGRNISGGQRQRIAIARALYKDADLIILDEPFSELDETSERQLLAHFSELAAEGKIIILVSHGVHGISYCNKTVLIHEHA